MDLETAHDICHAPYLQDRRTADTLAPFADPIAHACKNGYGLALHEYDAAGMNLRSFLRGMIPAEIVRENLKAARVALDKIEASLPSETAQ